MFLALVAGGCAARAQAPEGAGPAPDCEAFAARGLLPSARSRADLRAELGEPSNIDAEPTANRHVAGQVDTLVTYTYEDVSATFYVLPDRDLPTSVEVTGAGRLRFSAPTIGDSAGRVSALLGDPVRRERAADGGIAWEYACASFEGVEEPFVIVLRSDRVAAVRFTYYVD